MSKSKSKICDGSGLYAGAAYREKLVAPCPVCRASVVIGYQNRLRPHGKPKAKKPAGEGAAQEPPPQTWACLPCSEAERRMHGDPAIHKFSEACPRTGRKWGEPQG